MSLLPVCRDYIRGACTRPNCRFRHEEDNTNNQQPTTLNHKPKAPPRHRRPKNTETFEPLAKPVDIRIVCDLDCNKSSIPVQTRDVVLAPNVFADFAPKALYQQLEAEIMSCGVPQDQLLKLWHGDTHFIADDHLQWKKKAPTFAMVLDRIRNYFEMDIKATRFNWYKDTSQWKPFHRDAAALKPKQAEQQNFTVAVSFGATRDVAFEDMKSDTVISIPQSDGQIYAFARDTNILWKHGILKEPVTREEGRISIIAWGWIPQKEL